MHLPFGTTVAYFFQPTARRFCQLLQTSVKLQKHVFISNFKSLTKGADFYSIKGPIPCSALKGVTEEAVITGERKKIDLLTSKRKSQLAES